MTSIQKGFTIGILYFFLSILFLSILSGTVSAQYSPEDNNRDVIALLEEQNNKLSNDLRRIHREIAALRADLGKPDMKDVFAGIGYIFGLCGVAAFVASRRQK